MSRKSYEGAQVVVSFDPEVCQHVGNCVSGLATVFDTKNRPWINPDGDAPEKVIAQVARCPSGALRIEPR